MRLGIIGLGRVAWLLEQDPLRAKPCTHLGAWQQWREVSLVAACDLDPERLALFSSRYPEVRTYVDYREMLAREGLDFLSIAAYADTRCDMVLAACEAGVRGVWCEKAMATTVAEAQRIELAVASSNTRLAVGFPRRWSPLYRWVAEQLQAGAFGTLESVNVHFSGNLAHTGTHAFDVLRMWCGEVHAVQGWLQQDSQDVVDSGYRYGVPSRVDRPAGRSSTLKSGLELAGGIEGRPVSRAWEARTTSGEDLGGFAVLDFARGGRATIHAHAKGYFRFEFELLTTHCMLRIGNTQAELWQSDASANFAGFRELARRELPALPGINLFSAIAQSLYQSVTGNSPALRGLSDPSVSPPVTPIACTVVDGRKALEIALAVHESHGCGHRPVAPAEVNPVLAVVSR